MGAGGKSVFAMDVSDTTHLGSNSVLWEITDKETEALGHVTTRVSVGHVAKQGDYQGGWYAFIGNGHDAATKKAALIVVDLATGGIVRTIEVPSAANVGTPNGLTGVSLIRDTTGAVIGGYAGDLHGQVWRFEFIGAPSNWKPGFGNKPLFTARDAAGGVQMLSATPVHSKLSAKQGSTGHLVAFGTGRLVDEIDLQDHSTQTYYAVLDNTVGATSDSAGGNLTRDKLQAQEVLPHGGSPLIQLSQNTVKLSGEG